MNHPYVRGAVVIVLLVCATVMAVTGHLTETSFVGLATLTLGYVFGKASNGIDGVIKVITAMNTPPSAKNIDTKAGGPVNVDLGQLANWTPSPAPPENG